MIPLGLSTFIEGPSLFFLMNYCGFANYERRSCRRFVLDFSQAFVTAQNVISP